MRGYFCAIENEEVYLHLIKGEHDSASGCD